MEGSLKKIHSITFDSFNRDRGNNNSFTKDLHHNRHFTEYKVRTAQLPFSYYVVNSNTNVFNTSVANYTIDVGNYSSTSLITELNTVTGGDNFIWTYDSSTMKISVQNSVSAWTLTATTTMNQILGFGTPADTTTLHGVAAVIELPEVVQLGGTNMLYIVSNTIGGSTTHGTFNASVNGILAAIPVTTVPAGVTYFHDTSENYHWCNNNNMKNFDFKILDDNGNQIDFNGHPYSITVDFINKRAFFKN